MMMSDHFSDPGAVSAILRSSVERWIHPKATAFISAVILAVPIFSCPRLVSAEPRQAFVATATSKGQAMLLSHRGQCFAVLPSHVIGTATYATLAAQRIGTGLEEVGNQGDLVATLAGVEDVSVLAVTGAATDRCGEEYVGGAQKQSFGSAERGTIRSINEDGSVSQRAVTIIDDSRSEYLAVRADNQADRLFQGLSGSVLFVRDRPVGMLMGMYAEEQGAGRVLRLHAAFSSLQDFLTNGRGAATLPQPQMTSECDGIPTPLAEPSPDLATDTAGARILGWSGEILDERHRPENLLARQAGTCPWIVTARPAPGQPVTISIELAGESIPTITSVGIDGTGLEASGALPNQIEIATRAKEDQRWSPLKTVMLTRQKPFIDLRFGPTRARQLQFRIFSNWGAETVGLRRITVGAAR